MSLLDENGLSRVWSKMKAWVGTQLPGDFAGATTASAGTHGLVPAPTASDTEKFLKGDGTWANGSTDVNVTQTPTTTNADYRILLSGSADNVEHTEGAGKNVQFTANPSTGAVTFGSRAGSAGSNSFAQGQSVVASGTAAHAEGYETTAEGEYTHTEGNHTYAFEQASHAEGEYTIASGLGSHAEGWGTIATEYYSHAEGQATTASGSCSHAEGYDTLANGFYSHAEGTNTTASGSGSHAESAYTEASGNYAHAEGYHTIANHKSQHVFGEYNIDDNNDAAASARGTYVEIVGKGTANARSNARTLDWDGNEVLAGKLTVGAGPTNNMDVATKQYVDNQSGQIPVDPVDTTNLNIWIEST
ncbi:MAG: hypothetical protein J6T10_29315 [Methanobrevibacter sp.]|nr:hypothetical protein [Methanobrevibacter sp.]